MLHRPLIYSQKYFYSKLRFYCCFVGKPEGKRPLRRPSVDGRTELEWISGRLTEGMWSWLFSKPHSTRFLFAGSLKGEIVKRNPLTLHELEENIQKVIPRISAAQLQCVWTEACCRIATHVYEHKGSTFITSSEPASLVQNLLFPVLSSHWPG
jgi:hypothetical protein